MAGKAYTMREMRAIVEYINERKTYRELKGRKMWMEFANSNKTTRTWQSLKETFLKRILPDIHNPYYKLTMDQIRSFRAREDVAEKEKRNRLEFESPDKDLNGGRKSSEDQSEISSVKDNNVPTASHENEDQTKSKNEPPTTCIDEELEKVTGEDFKAAKIPSRSRSSAETIVLEYANAEDVQRALESPKNVKETKSKSLKDMITFEPSAPLSPLVRDLLDDFGMESEESDTEPRLRIDMPENNREPRALEDVIEQNNVEKEPCKNDTVNNEADSTIEIHDTDTSDSNEMIAKKRESVTLTKKPSNDDHQTKSDKYHSNKDSQSKNNEDDNIFILSSSYDNMNKTNTNMNCNKTIQQDDAIINTESSNKDTIVSVTEESNAKTFEKSSVTKAKSNTESNNSIIDNSGGSTQTIATNSLLPNNQEALDHKKEAKKTQHDTNEDTDKAKSEEDRIGKSLASRHILISKEINNSEPVIEISDTLSPSIYEPNTADNKISCDTPTINTQEQSNVIAKETLSSKPNTERSGEKDVPNTTNKGKDSIVVEDKNPSLPNVSLFDELLNHTKYSDSHSNAATKEKQNVEKPQTVTNKTKKTKDIPQKAKVRNEAEGSKKETAVVVEDNKNKKVDTNLISSTDCELQNEKVVNNKHNPTVNLQRERALANVFGFAHGGASRKRRTSQRRRSHHQRPRRSATRDPYSSEFTSESDNESYVSPPRGYGRHTKKYLKPRSSRVLQDPEEGKLYVIFGKKIYPLVKEGKHIKKFVSYRPDSGSDEEESNWKQKYIDEKKRNEKILQERQSGTTSQIIDQATTAQNNTNAHSSHKTGQNKTNTKIDEAPEAKDKNDNLVLQITGNGLEYRFEGAWYTISNAMLQVSKMLQFEMPVHTEKPKSANGEPNVPMDVTSGASTLVPTDVREIVNIKETEIFNTIKIIDALEKEVKPTETAATNVTTRKGRPRIVPPLQPVVSQKRTRSSKSNSTDSKQDESKTKRVTKQRLIPDNQEKESPADTKTTEPQADAEMKELKKVADKVVNKRLSLRSNSRSSKPREASEQSSLEDNSPVVTRASARLLRTPKKNDAVKSASDVKSRASIELPDFDDEEDARYKLPPAKTNKKSAGSKQRSFPEINIISPQDKLGDSVDNSCGYQDSDDPTTICLPKRNRRVSYIARKKYKNNRVTGRKSFPVLLQESSDCNNSFYFIPLKRSLSSTNSEVYISDSYRLLMPKQNINKKMERIDENNHELDAVDPIIRHFSSVSKDFNLPSDIGSSSNVSLPLSPELSVVENMSISREVIKDANHPTINESQQNMYSQPMDYSKYMISNLDISIPLMDQRCNLQKSTGATSIRNTSKSDCIQLKDCTVDITLSETLDRKLRALLLESNKKTKADNNKPTPMEVDQTIVTVKQNTKASKEKQNIHTDENVPAKNTRAKKRSSTPQKKKTVTKSKTPQNPTIAEEHIEFCAAGRKSCPPLLSFIPIDENANNNYDVTLKPAKVNNKKKKDIIKVKIKKPHYKTRSKENLRGKSVGNGSVASTYTDSGINDTETLSVMLKDSSIDLIHNHSETCLMANECIDSISVEFVKNSPTSIVSLSISRESEESVSINISENAVVLSEDTTNSQANNSPAQRTSDDIIESPETKYHTPIGSNSSLITEDLSDSPASQPTKWYLLDEDVTTMESPNMTGSGSNLRQLFPIACAVPDLSTISEASKENDDSSKTSDSLEKRLRNLFGDPKSC